MNVNAFKHRTGDAFLVFGYNAGRAGAGFHRVTIIATWAGTQCNTSPQADNGFDNGLSGINMQALQTARVLRVLVRSGMFQVNWEVIGCGFCIILGGKQLRS